MTELLKVEEVWKKYSRDLRKSVRFGAMELIGLRDSESKHSLEQSEFWALRDLSFSVRRGEVLGVLGHNGAGKSTLLKTVAGKLKPDRGRVTLNGSLSHIIEMSAGFSPAMTGRENVSVRGKLLGRRGKELQTYIDEVAEFADIGEFFDAPVQFYSSGMKARLGFSASVAVKPDILILDEVLAVGDLSFRLRCYDKISEITKDAAVLFVSHSLGHLRRLCTRGLYLEKGKMLHLGDIQDAITLYQDKFDIKGQKDTTAYRSERIDVSLRTLRETAEGSDPEFEYGEPLSLSIKPIDLPTDAKIRVVLRAAGTEVIADWNSERSFYKWPVDKAGLINADLGPLELRPGRYNIFVQVMSCDGADVICVSRSRWFNVNGKHLFEVPVQRKAQWTFTGATQMTPGARNGGDHE